MEECLKSAGLEEPVTFFIDCQTSFQINQQQQESDTAKIPSSTIQNKYENKGDSHACPHCKTIFAKAEYVRQHMQCKCVQQPTNGKNACSQCEKSFKYKYLLDRHLLTHSGHRPFHCIHCEKTFLSKAHLKRHSVVHLAKESQEHKCEVCNKAFAWPSQLKQHNKKHTNEKCFKCGICGHTFLHANNLWLHKANKHSVNGALVCIVCRSTFQQSTDLIAHMQMHSEHESVVCKRCLAYFSSLKDLETHLCSNFGGKPLLCSVCNIEFSETAFYCQHECIKRVENRVCGCCGKTLKGVWNLREHLITHTGEKPFSCDECHTNFRRKRELQIHMTKHNNLKTIACSHCSAMFTSEEYLKQHVRVEHRKKMFECTICKHAFTHKSTLDNHMNFHLRTGNTLFGKKNHRNNDAEQVCENLVVNEYNDASSVIEEASNSLFDPTNITTIYQRDESGNTYFRCAICLRDFYEHAALLRHRKEVHNEGKPYECNLCNRTFSVAANLSQHRMIHTSSGNAFSCKHCGKAYKMARQVRQHLLKKHAEDTAHLTDLELKLENSVNKPDEFSIPSIDITDNNLMLLPQIKPEEQKEDNMFIVNFSALINGIDGDE